MITLLVTIRYLSDWIEKVCGSLYMILVQYLLCWEVNVMIGDPIFMFQSSHGMTDLLDIIVDAGRTEWKSLEA
jgi:hypothetical protein